MADDESTRRSLSGVLPVFQTPFDADESIDFDVLAREFDFLFEHDIDGVVMAMVSEVLRLSDQERWELAEATTRQVSGRGVVIISVGAESTRQAIDFARHAEGVGSDAVMAIPPISTALSDEELRDYYEGIVSAIQIPVIVQDASGYVGRPMSIGVQAQLHANWGDRIQFKPEATPIGPRLSQLRDATDGKARIFEGSGGMHLVDSFRRGVTGTMPGADLIFATSALWHALGAGDSERADRIAQPLAAIVALQTSLDAFLAVEKHLLVRQGVFENEVVRGPKSFQLDEETRAEVDRLFDQLRDVVSSDPVGS